MTLDLSFKDLADVAAGGASDGRPLMVALEMIEEDPDQPRRQFAQDELRDLAASIRVEGILQPIVVRRSPQAGRFIIVMGARRYRAAKMAERVEVPVVVQDSAESSPYAQVVENIQRDNLKASEIARFVVARLEAGENQTEIARRLGKPRDWVSRYGAVPKMPLLLQEMLGSSSIRAVYELYQAWRQEPAAVELAIRSRDGFTDAEARTFASTIRSASDASANVGARSSKSSDAIPASTLGSDRGAVPKAVAPVSSHSATGSGQKASVIVRVRRGKRYGSLVLDGVATSGEGFARVAFDDAAVEDVAVGALRIEAISAG